MRVVVYSKILFSFVTLFELLRFKFFIKEFFGYWQNLYFVSNYFQTLSNKMIHSLLLDWSLYIPLLGFRKRLNFSIHK